MAAKSKGGRPSSYKPEFVAQAKKLCKLGATDVEMADFFGVDVRTFHRWKGDYPKFCHALRTGKQVADERVERSLYHRATGYTYDAVKVFMPSGAKKPVQAPYREHAPPDTTACIFWLKNRRPDLWRDRTQHEHTGARGGPIQTLDLTKATDEQLSALEAVFGPLAAPDRGAAGDRGGEGETQQ